MLWVRAMNSETKPILVGRVWRDPDCAGDPLAEQHRLANGQLVVSWTIDPETLRGPVWLEVVGTGPSEPSRSSTKREPQN